MLLFRCTPLRTILKSVWLCLAHLHLGTFGLQSHVVYLNIEKWCDIRACMINNLQLYR
jgi:hypothetical protein